MSHTYKRNYLKQVIFRLDFEPITLGDFKDFQLSNGSVFSEKNKLTAKAGGVEVNFDSGEVTNKIEAIDLWQFIDPATGNKFEIGPRHCLLEYTSYVDSTTLSEHINQLCKPLMKQYEVPQVLRMGLRYINQIDMPSIKKLADWKNYIQPDLLSGPLYLKENVGAPLRFINQIEMKIDSLASVQMQHGIWNDGYPSPITNNAYILDIDTFTRSPIGVEDQDIEEAKASLNKAAESIFELSITDRLRKEMDS